MRLGIGDNGYAELHIVQCMAGLWWYQGHQNCDLSKVSSRLWLKGFSNNFKAGSLVVIPTLIYWINLKSTYAFPCLFWLHGENKK